MKKILFLCFYLFSINSLATTTITTVGKQKPDDASHNYFIGLLRLALIETSSEYGDAIIETVPHPGQERMLKLLASGNFYDVAWSGSSKNRESELLKVPFPLFKGGLGWRGMVIKRQAIDKFSKIKNINDLSDVIACQGAHWPDADILEQAGITVYRVGHFDAMLQMVELQRCDYLPLSIFEGQAELDLVQNSFPNLVFYQGLIIQYPLTMNFFVNSKNTQLAERLTLGLSKLHHNGTFDNYMKNHNLTKNAFPLKKFKNANIIKLNNLNNAGNTLSEFGLKWPEN